MRICLIAGCFFLTLVSSALADAVGITNNVFLRTKRIIAGPASGTTFTIDADGRQYLITAKHVVAALPGPQAIVQVCDDQTQCADVQVTILRCGDPIDIAVLVPTRQITIAFPLPPDSGGMNIGQDVYFVGFPFGDYSLTTNAGHVRKAVFSAQEKTNAYRRLYLDGWNNPGFSGSPVVFVPPGRPNNEFKVAAVISGYRPEPSQVKAMVPIDASQIVPQDRALNRIIDFADGSHRKLVDTDLLVPGNSAIVVAYTIDQAVDLIERAMQKVPK